MLIKASWNSKIPKCKETRKANLIGGRNYCYSSTTLMIRFYKYWLWLFPFSTLWTLFATGSVIMGWFILYKHSLYLQWDKEPTSLYRAAAVTAGAMLVPLCSGSSFQVDAHWSGLFALHVKLDQHLLNINRKRVGRINFTSYLTSLLMNKHVWLCEYEASPNM